MPSQKYTKAQLEQVVYTQLENLNAIHDLLRIMKVQNELIENANKKLKDEVIDFKKRVNYKQENLNNLIIIKQAVFGYFTNITFWFFCNTD